MSRPSPPSAKSGRGRAYARRPPTTPDVRFTYPAFPVTWSGLPATARCVSCVVSPAGRLWTPLPPARLTASTARAAGSPSTVTSVLTDSESTRDYPLMTGSALRDTGAVSLLRPLLTAARPSRHLAMAVAHRQASSPPRVMRATFVLCPSDIRSGVPCKYRASHLWACLPTPPRLNPLPVRRTSTLPAASSDPGSPRTPLPFGYHFPLPGVERTFTSKSPPRHHAGTDSASHGAARHAWRTQKKGPHVEGQSGGDLYCSAASQDAATQPISVCRSPADRAEGAMAASEAAPRVAA